MSFQFFQAESLSEAHVSAQQGSARHRFRSDGGDAHSGWSPAEQTNMGSSPHGPLADLSALNVVATVAKPFPAPGSADAGRSHPTAGTGWVPLLKGAGLQRIRTARLGVRAPFGAASPLGSRSGRTTPASARNGSVNPTHCTQGLFGRSSGSLRP